MLQGRVVLTRLRTIVKREMLAGTIVARGRADHSRRRGRGFHHSACTVDADTLVGVAASNGSEVHPAKFRRAVWVGFLTVARAAVIGSTLNAGQV